MKKIITVILTILLTSSLYAEDTTKKAKLASDMRTMLEAVGAIQRAGFYNNKKGVKMAAKTLISNLNSLIEIDATTYLPESKANAGKFAKKRAKMIKMYAEDLIVSIETDDFSESLEDYTQILKQCTSCHSRIRQRQWK